MKIDRTRLLVVGRAVIVGILVGIVVSAFRWLVEAILEQWRYIYHQIGHAANWPIWLSGTIVGMIGLTILVGLII